MQVLQGEANHFICYFHWNWVGEGGEIRGSVTSTSHQHCQRDQERTSWNPDSFAGKFVCRWRKQEVIWWRPTGGLQELATFIFVCTKLPNCLPNRPPLTLNRTTAGYWQTTTESQRKTHLSTCEMINSKIACISVTLLSFKCIYLFLVSKQLFLYYVELSTLPSVQCFKTPKALTANRQDGSRVLNLNAHLQLSATPYYSLGFPQT